jgi:CheY-like chemotaxis protein
MKPLNVFIVDDDKLFVFLTKKTMNGTKIAINVTEFADGQEAITYLNKIANNKELLPDIIFLDLSMPIMDGWEFIEEYKQIKQKMDKEIKLYIFSSSISPHDIERAKTISEVNDFIIKPLVQDKFIEMLRAS